MLTQLLRLMAELRCSWLCLVLRRKILVHSGLLLGDMLTNFLIPQLRLICQASLSGQIALLVGLCRSNGFARMLLMNVLMAYH